MKMRKKIFAGVLTAMMLVLTMGTAVFANVSPNSDAALQKKVEELVFKGQSATDANGKAIPITSSKVAPSVYVEAQAEAKNAAVAANYKNANVLAIANLEANGAQNVKVTLTVPGLQSGKQYIVLHKAKNSSAWEQIKPDSISGNTITVTLKSLSPVAVAEYTNDDSGSSGSSGTSGSSESSDSNNTNNNYNTNSTGSQSSSQNNNQSNPQTNNNNQSNTQSNNNNQNNPVNVRQNVTVNYPDSDEDGNYDEGYSDGYADGVNSVKGNSEGGRNSGLASGTSASYVTSPKTGAALPALPIVAVFAFAGTVVCHRKTRSN